MTLNVLFDRFVQSGLYLRGWSPRTAPIYRRAFASFQQSFGDAVRFDQQSAGPVVSKSSLEAWVIGMRQRGLSPACCNIYIRAMNSFCAWLHGEEHTPARIKLTQLKAPSKPVAVISAVEVRTLVVWKPKRAKFLRPWMLSVLMLDTGCRIDEVLRLKPHDVDFDNLLLTVNGKGSKVRRVPFSIEMRKHLHRFLQNHGGRAYVFGTGNGTPTSYRNAYRSVKSCFAGVGIEGPHIHPHNLRHTFACNYIKAGGSVVALSRILGHSSITTTQVYLRGLNVEELAHFSPLQPR